MQAFIASDQVPISLRVRQVLLPWVQEAAAAPVVSFDRAAQRLSQSPCDVLIVVLSPDPQRGLAVLQELRGLTQAHVLAVGPSGDSRLVLTVLRAGAADYVDEANLEADLQAALKRLPIGDTPRGDAGQLIALLSPSGGSGASTLAASLATVYANEHRSALLVDLRLEANDLASLMDLRPTHTLADLCQNAARMDKDMFERSLAKHTTGVRLLAPPRSFADIPSVTAEGVREALTLGRSLFPYVVADVDNSLREEQLLTLRQADVIVVVIRLDFTSLRNTQRMLEHLERMGISRERLRLVVNRYGQPKEVPYDKAEQALGTKIFQYIPDDPKTVNRANNNGVPVVLESPSAKVSKTILQLAASINGRQQGR